MVTIEAKKKFQLLAAHEKKAIATKAGISRSYLYCIFYSGIKPSPVVACRIEKASGFKIRRYEILPDFDWSIF